MSPIVAGKAEEAKIQSQIRDIPRGETQRGVTAEVLLQLEKRGLLRPGVRILDAPCGKGKWLSFLASKFPQTDFVGADLTPPSGVPLPFSFFPADLSHEFSIGNGTPFDAVTCISGVMCFGNTSLFVEQVVKHLKPGGWLILTNDNIWTVRDRFYFLLFGTFRSGRFRLGYYRNAINWNVIPIQTLLRILQNHGLEIEEIKYTSRYPGDWLWSPFAAFFGLCQYLYLRRGPSHRLITPRIRTSLFKALLARHYVIVCRRPNA